MTFRHSARECALKAAADLESRANQMAIMRSVDATESARWLKALSAQIRDACEKEHVLKGATEEECDGLPTVEQCDELLAEADAVLNKVKPHLR